MSLFFLGGGGGVFEAGFLCVALTVLELTFVDQAGLKLRNPPAFASQVLGLKACATTAPLSVNILTMLSTSTEPRLWTYIIGI